MNDREGILSYDLATLPTNMQVVELLEIMKETNTVFYDSFNKGNKPEVLEEFIQDMLILDIATPEGKDKLDKK